MCCRRPILMEVTRSPQFFRSTPILLAVTPFPSPLTTPPVTRTYFIFLAAMQQLLYALATTTAPFPTTHGMFPEKSHSAAVSQAGLVTRGLKIQRSQDRARHCFSSLLQADSIARFTKVALIL